MAPRVLGSNPSSRQPQNGYEKLQQRVQGSGPPLEIPRAAASGLAGSLCQERPLCSTRTARPLPGGRESKKHLGWGKGALPAARSLSHSANTLPAGAGRAARAAGTGQRPRLYLPRLAPPGTRAEGRRPQRQKVGGTG